MAWNKTQAVVLYAVLIWALYNGTSGFYSEGRGYTGSGRAWPKGGGGATVTQLTAGVGELEFMGTGATGGGQPAY